MSGSFEKLSKNNDIAKTPSLGNLKKIDMTNISLCKRRTKALIFFLLLFIPTLILYFKPADPGSLIHKFTQKIYKGNISIINVFTPPEPQNNRTRWKGGIRCFNAPQEDKEILVVPGYKVLPNSIFFIEASCRNLSFTKRQACAYESAARANPNSEVLVLFPSPISMQKLDSFTSKLVKYSNLKFLHIDMDNYFVDTPLAEFNLPEKLGKSPWPSIHLSDILRLVTLWKYGGTYVDWDYFTFRSFGNMKNFVGAENGWSINNAVLNFSNDGKGRHLMNEILNELKNTLRGEYWAEGLWNLGPKLITKVIKGNICHEKKTFQMTPKKCKGLTVFLPPPMSPIYPTVPGPAALELAKKKLNGDIANTLGQSFGFHMMNSFTSKTTIKTGSRSVYDVLASWFCPHVYSDFGDHF